ncbi:MAG TPA: GNAT family N-acetyltransferase [Tepidisphaeraceae bacterium]|jgi:GNAT superfamily N-acetyltransferase|nr:GNAT family N-acetyltransferase [Tepidisphaeraceae bacterium]
MEPTGANEMVLRLATESDWAVVRAVRLEALREEPGVFGSSLAREVAYDEAKWRTWAAGPAGATFLLADGADVVGLTGVIVEADDPTTARCVASYIRRAYRGRGLSGRFYEVRIAWARARGCVRIVTGHRLSNAASMRANQPFGFTETHRAPHRWPDGVEEAVVLYELRL